MNIELHSKSMQPNSCKCQKADKSCADFCLATKDLYMSFDKFLLAVESRDLSQADKSIIRVLSFPDLTDG